MSVIESFQKDKKDWVLRDVLNSSQNHYHRQLYLEGCFSKGYMYL